MELLESWLGALSMLTEPYWLTLQALGGLIVSAGAGTAIFGIFLMFLALDFLRVSKGPFVLVSRVAAIATSLFVVSTFIYGDFLAAPAKAAYSAIVMRSPKVPSSVVALTTLSAAGAGLFFYAGRQSAPRTLALAPPRPTMRALMSARREAGGFRIADFGKAMTLDPAGRLQLRQLSRNPKKAAYTVRPAVRYAGGRRVAHA